MQPQVELEQAVGTHEVIAAAAEATEGKGIYWVIKNSMARQRVHDTAGDITVESLTSARARISELEGQLRDMLNEAIANSKAQIAANSAAQSAADSATRASALAEEAQRNALQAQQDAELARNLLAVWMGYARRLRALMIEAGIEPPPEPDLNVEPET
jgi:hypothetical protein